MVCFMDAYFIHYEPTNKLNVPPESVLKALRQNGVKIDYECEESPVIIAFIPNEKLDVIKSLEGIIKVDIVPEDLTR